MFKVKTKAVEANGNVSVTVFINRDHVSAIAIDAAGSTILLSNGLAYLVEQTPAQLESLMFPKPVAPVPAAP